MHQMQPVVKKHRFEGLDIFRGLFSGMVVLFHMSVFSDTVVINNNFVINSDLFVDFFFVLSGFVIAYSYRSIESVAALALFLKKRLFRIYPLHLVMLLVFLFTESVKHYLQPYIHINQLNNANNNLTSFLSSLFLLNSIKIKGITDVSWNIPSWSISAEMIAYIVYALATLLILSIGLYKKRIWFFIVIILSSLTLLYALTQNFALNYSFDYGFLRGITGFFMGIICCNTFEYSYNYFQSFKTSFFHTCEVVSIALIVFFVSCGDVFKSFGFIYEILFFISILIFAFERGFVSALLLKSNFLKKMGKYSYSIYMTHALLLSLFNILFIRILKFDPSAYSYLFILNYILIYKVSARTYEHIEKRFTVNKKSIKNSSIEPVYHTNNFFEKAGN